MILVSVSRYNLDNPSVHPSAFEWRPPHTLHGLLLEAITAMERIGDGYVPHYAHIHRPGFAGGSCRINLGGALLANGIGISPDKDYMEMGKELDDSIMRAIMALQCLEDGNAGDAYSIFYENDAPAPFDHQNIYMEHNRYFGWNDTVYRFLREMREKIHKYMISISI